MTPNFALRKLEHTRSRGARLLVNIAQLTNRLFVLLAAGALPSAMAVALCTALPLNAA